MIEGECLCGSVRYVVKGDIGEVSHCHCSMCRRIHGAAFGTYGAVTRDSFCWLSGSELVQVYRSSESVDRTFCSVCGSTLQAIFETEPDVLYLALGTTNGDPKCRPSFHIFVGSMALWYEIEDDLPQHDTWSYVK